MRGLKLVLGTAVLAVIACGDDDGAMPSAEPDGSAHETGGSGGSDSGSGGSNGGSGGANGGTGGTTGGTGGSNAGSGGAVSMDASTDSGGGGEPTDSGGSDATPDEDGDAPTEDFLRAWPTDDAVTEVDGMDAFGMDVSGLIYQPNGAGPGVLWASMNRPPSMAYRLEKTGATWARAAANGWGGGKTLLYPDGVGVPDAESVTKAEYAADVIYIGSESNLSAAGSRNAVLSYDVSGAGASLTATREWNLTSMLPATGKNQGIEAITWIPDSALVAEGFVEDSGAAYVPGNYPNHGTGLFVVGLESQSELYFFALGSGGEITLIASAETELAGVMGLEYDRDVGYLWAYCDNICQNRALILTVNDDGAFERRAELMRPASMPDINNEGIAIAPESECVAGKKPFFWVEDGITNGHVLRAGTIPCGPFL